MMHHLTAEQLSALLDGRLEGEQRGRAERHLEGCPSCREARAGLEAQERLLAHALEHDPGEAYFEGFAARVSNRLRTESLAGAQVRQGGALARLFRSPRRLAIVGSLAAVVVGAGVVLMSIEEAQFPQLRSGKAVRMAETPVPAPGPTAAKRSAPPAPSFAILPGRTQSPQDAAPPVVTPPAARPRGAVTSQAPVLPFQSPSNEPPAALDGTVRSKATDRGARAPAMAQSPSRMYQVRRDEHGEDVPVRPSELQRFRSYAPSPPPAPAGQPTFVRKFNRPEPMQQKLAEGAPVPQQNLVGGAPAPREAGADTSAAGAMASQAERSAEDVLALPAPEAARLCGDVRDPLGRPVVGAQVVVRDNGVTARTDGQGHFCLQAPAGSKTLTVMAVGFHSADLNVRIGPEEPYASVELAPVSPLPAWGTTKSLFRSPGDTRTMGYRDASPSGRRLPAIEVLSPAARNAMSEARRLSAVADRAHDAPSSMGAAAAWEHAADLLPDGAASRDARFQAAKARYEAWQYKPSDEAMHLATIAIQRVLAIEPAGPRRTMVEGWQAQLVH